MKRNYFYTVTINNANSCDFNTKAEAEAYKESFRQEDGSYKYSITNSKGVTFTMKADIVIKKRWELA